MRSMIIRLFFSVVFGFISASALAAENCVPAPLHGESNFCEGFNSTANCRCLEDAGPFAFKCTSTSAAYDLMIKNLKTVASGCTFAINKHSGDQLTPAECANQWSCAKDGHSTDGTSCGNLVAGHPCPGSGFPDSN